MTLIFVVLKQEHEYQMALEAERDQEIADKAEEEEQERIRFMWKANEIADLSWEIYSQEFPEYYEDYEDNMRMIADFNASVPPNTVIPQQAPLFPTQQSQAAKNEKNKGKEPAEVIPDAPEEPAEVIPDIAQDLAAKNEKNKGKEPAEVIPDAPEDGQKNQGKKRGRKPKAETPSYGRIYYKNRGRSERIANQKKAFKFDEFGTGSTPEKAFSVD